MLEGFIVENVIHKVLGKLDRFWLKKFLDYNETLIVCQQLFEVDSTYVNNPQFHLHESMLCQLQRDLMGLHWNTEFYEMFLQTCQQVHLVILTQPAPLNKDL